MSDNYIPVVECTFPCVHSLLKAMCEHGRFEYTRLSWEHDQKIIKELAKCEGTVLHIEHTDGCDVTTIWPITNWMRSVERQAKFKAFHDKERELRDKRKDVRERVLIVISAMLSCDKSMAIKFLDEALAKGKFSGKMFGLSAEDEEALKSNETFRYI